MSDDAAAGSDAILLLGFPQSGKTDTLRTWVGLLQFLHPETGDQISMSGVVRTGTAKINRYVLSHEGRRIQVVDVPGEIVDDYAPGAAALRQRLYALNLDVRAVLVFSPPPGWDGPRESLPAPGFIIEPEQYSQELQDLDARPLTPVEATNRLNQCLHFVQGLVGSRGRRMADVPVIVQLGFADLTALSRKRLGRWEVEAQALMREVADVWPGGADLTFKDPEEVRRRLDLYRAIAARTTRLYPWLTGEGVGGAATPVHRAFPRLRPWFFPQTNRTPNFPGLGQVSHAVGLVHALDQIFGREALALDAGARWRRRLARLAAAGAAVAGLVGVAAFGYFHPAVLPPALAAAACTRDGPAYPPRGCACVEIRLASPPRQAPLAERLAFAGAHLDACQAGAPEAVARRPGAATALLHRELASALTAPGAFSPERVRTALEWGAEPGGGPPDAPWFPAVTRGEVALAEALLSAAGGRTRASVREVHGALSPEEREAFPELAKELGRAADLDPCVRAWREARGSGRWDEAHRTCGSVTLPEAWGSCLAADLPPRSKVPKQRNGRTVLEITPLMLPSGSAAEPCTSLDGLSALLLDVPSPDALTYANRAALVGARGDVAAFTADLGRADSAPGKPPHWPAHRHLLELLVQPDPALLEAAVASLDSDTVRAMEQVLLGGWLPFTGRRGAVRLLGDPLRMSGGDGRRVRLPSSRVDEVARALVGVPPAAPETGPDAVPWSHPLAVGPLAPESAEAGRARVAALLAAEGSGRGTDAERLGFEVHRLVLELRSAPQDRRVEALARVVATLEPLEAPPAAPVPAPDPASPAAPGALPPPDEGPPGPGEPAIATVSLATLLEPVPVTPLASAARDLHCQVVAEWQVPAEVLALVERFQAWEDGEAARRCAALASLSVLIRGRPKDAEAMVAATGTALGADAGRALADAAELAGMTGERPADRVLDVSRRLREHLGDPVLLPWMAQVEARLAAAPGSAP